MRYTYKINDGTEIQAMSYKKMLKKLPSKYPEGTMLNIGYINKKKKQYSDFSSRTKKITAKEQ